MTNPAFNNLPRLSMEGALTMGKTVLFKGLSGGGKTSAALSFPEPLYCFYADKNEEVAANALLGGSKITIVSVRNWDDYENVIVPEVKAGNIEARTLVVDTLDFVSQYLMIQLQGSKTRPNFDDYNVMLRKFWSTTADFVGAAKPGPNHPGYHIVFTCHYKDITDDAGALLGYQCNIPGQFKDHVEDFFNYVLLCEAGVVTKMEAGKAKQERQFKIHSVPPNRYHTCKGGKLPPEILIPEGGNVFEILNQHWKIKE